MSKEYKEAEEIANSLREQIARMVGDELSSDRIAELAVYTAECMRAVAPMYSGNLNPNWVKYGTVIQILKENLI